MRLALRFDLALAHFLPSSTYTCYPFSCWACGPDLQSLGTSRSGIQDFRVSQNVPSNCACIAWELVRNIRLLLNQKPCWRPKEYGLTGVGKSENLYKSNEETQTCEPSELRNEPREGHRAGTFSQLHLACLYSGGLFRIPVCLQTPCPKELWSCYS